MSIKSIEVLNVMVFQRQCGENYNDFTSDKLNTDNINDASFKLNFSDGINVLIGENGVGKTTLLKMIYAATQWSIKQPNSRKSKRLLQFFSNNLDDSESLMNTENNHCYYKVSDGEHIFEDKLSPNKVVNNDEWLELNIQSVFIPTTEMLSHSNGFLALDQKFNMPFDRTQVDIIVNASLPEAREIPSAMSGILEKISAVIDGTVILENDSFYVVKKNGQKVDFSLEAEGLRKLGLIWKLIRNGLLERNTILLWDEPEANLNPELYPLVVEILLELEKNGVQIFVATHSYNFAKYLEIRRTRKEQVMFHNLYKETPELPADSQQLLPSINKCSDAIYSKSAYKMEDVKPNHIMLADNRLLDEIYNFNNGR